MIKCGKLQLESSTIFNDYIYPSSADACGTQQLAYLQSLTKIHFSVRELSDSVFDSIKEIGKLKEASLYFLFIY